MCLEACKGLRTTVVWYVRDLKDKEVLHAKTRLYKE